MNHRKSFSTLTKTLVLCIIMAYVGFEPCWHLIYRTPSHWAFEGSFSNNVNVCLVFSRNGHKLSHNSFERIFLFKFSAFYYTWTSGAFPFRFMFRKTRSNVSRSVRWLKIATRDSVPQPLGSIKQSNTPGMNARTWSNKKTADMNGLRYSPDDPYYRLGPVHTCPCVRACRLVTGTSS